MEPKKKESIRPVFTETAGAEQKSWQEDPIPEVYGILDNDLARDNLENDIPFADLQDL